MSHQFEIKWRPFPKSKEGSDKGLRFSTIAFISTNEDFTFFFFIMMLLTFFYSPIFPFFRQYNKNPLSCCCQATKILSNSMFILFGDQTESTGMIRAEEVKRVLCRPTTFIQISRLIKVIGKKKKNFFSNVKVVI